MTFEMGIRPAIICKLINQCFYKHFILDTGCPILMEHILNASILDYVSHNDGIHFKCIQLV